MGMFDYVNCRYPLPLAGANGLEYQTKSLDCAMDSYEIREDGTLWHEEYDVEDRSNPNADGFMRLVGMLTRVNRRWEPLELTGEVCFYGSMRDDWKNWIEWSAYFVRGQLKELHLLEHEQPQSVDAVDPFDGISTD